MPTASPTTNSPTPPHCSASANTPGSPHARDGREPNLLFHPGLGGHPPACGATLPRVARAPAPVPPSPEPSTAHQLREGEPSDERQQRHRTAPAPPRRAGHRHPVGGDDPWVSTSPS